MIAYLDLKVSGELKDKDFVTIDYVSFKTKDGKEYSMSDVESEVGKFSGDSESAVFGYKWRGIQILTFEENGTERWLTEEEIVKILMNVEELTDFQIYCSDNQLEYNMGDPEVKPEIDDIHIYYIENNTEKEIHLGGVK